MAAAPRFTHGDFIDYLQSQGVKVRESKYSLDPKDHAPLIYYSRQVDGDDIRVPAYPHDRDSIPGHDEWNAICRSLGVPTQDWVSYGMQRRA